MSKVIRLVIWVYNSYSSTVRWVIMIKMYDKCKSKKSKYFYIFKAKYLTKFSGGQNIVYLFYFDVKMLGKNNQFVNQKQAGRKFEKYSIKILKVGFACVLVESGFFLGFHVEVSEVNKPVTNEVVSSSAKENNEKVVTVEDKSIETTPFTENKLVEVKIQILQ